MSDIPPKQPVSGTASARVESAYGLPPFAQAESSPDMDATGALVSLHHAASQSGTDSFPVLKAFQEYLESERRRARRRVALVSALFAGILVFVIAVFLTAGMLMFRYMKENQDNLWRKLDTQAAPAPAVATVAAATPGTDALSEEVQRLGTALADLKRDNAQLRDAFKTQSAPKVAAAQRSPPAARPPAPAARPPAPAARPPAATVAATPRPLTLEVPAGVKSPPPPAGFAEGGIYLQPGGKGVPIPWRVYLPAR